MSTDTINKSAAALLSTATGGVPRVAVKEPEIAGSTIRPDAARKAEAEAALVASQLGISQRDTFFAYGTKMLDMGERRARQLRSEWEARPLVTDGMAELVKLIEGEKRQDAVIPLDGFKLDGDGFLTREGKSTRLDPSDRAWSQIISMGRAAGVAPANAAAGNLNRWLHRMKRDALVRTRRPGDGTRDLFAVLSPKYATVDADRIARSVAATAPKGARVVVRYDGHRIEIDVSLAAEHNVGDGSLGVGRLHRVGFRITSADDGTEAIKVRVYAERIACINCTILADERLTLNRKHVGQADVVRMMVVDAMAQAATAINRFGQLWSEVNRTKVDAPELIKRVAYSGELEIPGVDSATLHGMLVGTFAKEPGNTLADVHNAVTRLAHEGAWSSAWVTDGIEESAGRLLYAGGYLKLPEVDAA